MKRFLIMCTLCLALISCTNKTVIENESLAPFPASSSEEAEDDFPKYEYIVNTSTKTYHAQGCSYASRINEENRIISTDLDFLIERGYTPCSACLDNSAQ